MMRGILLILLPVAHLLHIGCSRPIEPISGGGSDLPEIKVSLADKSPAVGAQILVFSGNYNPGADADPGTVFKKVVSELTADESGFFKVENIEEDVFYLEVTSADVSEVAIAGPFEKDETYTLNEVTTASAGEISGIVVSDQLPVGTVYLAGTHHRATPNAAGQISLTGIPGGEYMLCAALKKPNHTVKGSAWGFAPGEDDIWILQDKLSLQPGEKRDLETMHIIIDALLLWEFEGETQNLLKGIAYPEDNSNAGIWNVLPQGVEDGAFRGKSAQLSGKRLFQIGIAGMYYDFSNMTELVFYAKGPGSLQIAFRSQLVLPGEGSLIADREIPAEWTKISVKPEEIYPAPGSVSESRALTWEHVKGGITIIDFNTPEAQTIYVDEIYLLGVKREDLQQ